MISLSQFKRLQAYLLRRYSDEGLEAVNTRLRAFGLDSFLNAVRQDYIRLLHAIKGDGKLIQVVYCHHCNDFVLADNLVCRVHTGVTSGKHILVGSCVFCRSKVSKYIFYNDYLAIKCPMMRID